MSDKDNGIDEVFDFGDGLGPVGAARHQNPNGTIGGWVATTATVTANAWVSVGATVGGHAMVGDMANIFDTATVGDYATVEGCATVGGNARVGGNATVEGCATVGGNARVGGDVTVTGNATLGGEARVKGAYDVSHGTSGGYHWTAYVTDLEVWLQYGCESRPLAWWLAVNLKKLCERHNHSNLHSPFVEVAVISAQAIAARWRLTLPANS